MLLSAAQRGDVLEVVEVLEPGVEAQCLRLGLSAGRRVECVRSLHRGPVVVRCGTCELAIGRTLASRIAVRTLPEAEKASTARSVGGLTRVR